MAAFQNRHALLTSLSKIFRWWADASTWLAGDPCPTLVYRHQKHLISLTEMPAGSRLDLAGTPRTINGYNVVHWTDNGVSYWAISDLAAAKLEDFARLFRTTPAES
jgi:anti-sigma factor RsiW